MSQWGREKPLSAGEGEPQALKRGSRLFLLPTFAASHRKSF
jgi:hypothetical protein